MMPQDFASSGVAPAASRAAVHASEARTALARVERDLRELRQRWAGAEARRHDLTPEVVPALAALTDRLEALTLDVRAHRSVRP